MKYLLVLLLLSGCTHWYKECRRVCLPDEGCSRVCKMPDAWVDEDER